MRKRFAVATALAAAFLAGAVVGPVSIWGSSAQIPAYVVKDSNMNVVGPVVGLLSSHFPVLGLTDPDFGNLISMEVVDGARLRGGSNDVYFAGMNCSGQPYLIPPAEEIGLPILQGRNYGAAYDSTGDLKIYRSDGTTGSSVMYDSRYSAFLSPTCTNSTNTRSLVTATSIINLSMTNPPPFTVD